MANKIILLSAIASMVAVNLRSSAAPHTFAETYGRPAMDKPVHNFKPTRTSVASQKRAKKKRRNKSKRK